MALTELVYTSAAQVERMLAEKSRKLMGFSRKARPNLPNVPPLYVFNVSNKEYKWREPGFEQYIVPACKDGEEYSTPCMIPGIVIEEVLIVDKTELNMYNAEEIAMAIFHAGPGMRPQGDLRKFGLFVSRTNPPSDEDVAHAQHLLMQTCEALVADGDRIHAEGQSKGLGGQMITDEHRWAAKQAKQEREWSKGIVPMKECPVCHRPVARSAAVHLPWSECGAVLDWDKAIAAGLKKEEDRPVPAHARKPKPQQQVAEA